MLSYTSLLHADITTKVASLLLLTVAAAAAAACCCCCCCVLLCHPPHPPLTVRALQLGLSVVPRVDPRMPRSLADYCTIYREWLLLLRGRLAQAGVDLPEALFAEGAEGDEELMRFALCYNILQVVLMLLLLFGN
jgi:hypothetical protein